MRIEAYNQVQQVYNTRKPGQVKHTAGAAPKDQVQISSMGKDFQTVKAAVAAAPDVREDITAPIKASMDAGTYEVSMDSFADRLMKKYEEMR